MYNSSRIVINLCLSLQFIHFTCLSRYIFPLSIHSQWIQTESTFTYFTSCGLGQNPLFTHVISCGLGQSPLLIHFTSCGFGQSPLFIHFTSCELGLSFLFIYFTICQKLGRQYIQLRLQHSPVCLAVQFSGVLCFRRLFSLAGVFRILFFFSFLGQWEATRS